ncbi:MAG: hypothetical protein ACMV1B_09335 [Prevotella sp.]
MLSDLWEFIMNKQLSIRFLKQGLVHIEVPIETSTAEVLELAKSQLDIMSDQDLVMAMSDCTPSGLHPSRFDADSFRVEAIEDEEYNLLYATPLWKAYANE